MSDLTSFQTVQTSMRSAKFDASDPRLDLFDEFCQLVERTPDEMVSECLKIVQAGSRPRVPDGRGKSSSAASPSG